MSFWVFVAYCHRCSNFHWMKKEAWFLDKDLVSSPWVFYILARQLLCPYWDDHHALLMTQTVAEEICHDDAAVGC